MFGKDLEDFVRDRVARRAKPDGASATSQLNRRRTLADLAGNLGSAQANEVVAVIEAVIADFVAVLGGREQTVPRRIACEISTYREERERKAPCVSETAKSVDRRIVHERPNPVGYGKAVDLEVMVDFVEIYADGCDSHDASPFRGVRRVTASAHVVSPGTGAEFRNHHKEHVYSLSVRSSRRRARAQNERADALEGRRLSLSERPLAARS